MWDNYALLASIKLDLQQTLAKYGSVEIRQHSDGMLILDYDNRVTDWLLRLTITTVSGDLRVGKVLPASGRFILISDIDLQQPDAFDKLNMVVVDQIKIYDRLCETLATSVSKV